jgi:hypothetical protein
MDFTHLFAAKCPLDAAKVNETAEQALKYTAQTASSP